MVWLADYKLNNTEIQTLYECGDTFLKFFIVLFPERVSAKIELLATCTHMHTHMHSLSCFLLVAFCFKGFLVITKITNPFLLNFLFSLWCLHLTIDLVVLCTVLLTVHFCFSGDFTHTLENVATLWWWSWCLVLGFFLWGERKKQQQKSHTTITTTTTK